MHRRGQAANAPAHHGSNNSRRFRYGRQFFEIRQRRGRPLPGRKIRLAPHVDRIQSGKNVPKKTVPSRMERRAARVNRSRSKVFAAYRQLRPNSRQPKWIAPQYPTESACLRPASEIPARAVSPAVANASAASTSTAWLRGDRFRASLAGFCRASAEFPKAASRKAPLSSPNATFSLSPARSAEAAARRVRFRAFREMTCICLAVGFQRKSPVLRLRPSGEPRGLFPASQSNPLQESSAHKGCSCRISSIQFSRLGLPERLPRLV